MLLQISSGRGPVECERAVYLFAHVLVQELTKQGFKATMTKEEKGVASGCCKSVVICAASGDERVFKELEGSILWICKSAYRKGIKRKNWYITVNLCADFQALSSDEKQITFSTMRSSGAGGQNVNKVETGVRAVYQPLDISIAATKERSQHLNKKLASKLVAAKIQNINESKQQEHKSNIWSTHNQLERGNALRVYEGEAFKRIK